MAKTVAIYQQLPTGMFRVGVFRYRGTGQSLYAIAQAFHQRCPHAHKAGQLFISKRMYLNGTWTDDSERIPMDAPAQPRE